MAFTLEITKAIAFLYHLEEKIDITEFIALAASQAVYYIIKI